MWKRLILIGTIGAIVGIFVVSFNPVNSKMLKLALLGFGFGAWAGVTILCWKRRVARAVMLCLPVLAGLPYLLPGGEIDRDELRADYVKRMSAFEGTDYHWGGESSRGIDCSGLPRRAFREALFSYGIRKFNGTATRAFLEQWWFDASAKALGEQYRGYTRAVGVGGEIEEMSYAGLKPGDFAVTDNGVHVIAYVEGDKWIQADPGVGSVVTLDGRKDDNVWFEIPVKVYRWSLLAK